METIDIAHRSVLDFYELNEYFKMRFFMGVLLVYFTIHKINITPVYIECLDHMQGMSILLHNLMFLYYCITHIY